MNYYKLEATHNIISISNKKYPYKSKRTYKYFCGSYEIMLIRLNDCLNNKGKAVVKSISEAEYVRGTR
jgi:hypothetical protein